ncbi:MAG: hypothetical protein AB1450_09045 [Pseudomonadota bacterium]
MDRHADGAGQAAELSLSGGWIAVYSAKGRCWASCVSPTYALKIENIAEIQICNLVVVGGRMEDISDFESLCTAIGFVEVNWALFEQSLDLIVLAAHRDLGGATFEKEIPRSYSRKVNFLKKAFSKISVLVPLKREAIELLDISCKLSKMRHDLTHGVVTHIQAVDGRYTFSKIDYVSHGHTYRDFVFNPEDFPRLAEDLLRLGSQATCLGIKIGEIERHQNS